jgi:hypothetical protein
MILFTDWLIVLLVACLFLVKLIRSNVCYFLQSSTASGHFYSLLFLLSFLLSRSSLFPSFLPRDLLLSLFVLFPLFAFSLPAIFTSRLDLSS